MLGCIELIINQTFYKCKKNMMIATKSMIFSIVSLTNLQ